MATEDQPDAHAADLAQAVRSARASVGALSARIGASGAPAAEAAPALRAAQQVLDALEVQLARLRPDAAAGSALFVDVSDLLGYFPHNRLPTGIQRVQISTIFRLVEQADITLCRFVEGRDEWLAVPPAPFAAVCAASIAGGDPTDLDWHAQVRSLDTAISAAPSLRFPEGACLINLGTSWWLPNYFLHIRQAKRESGLFYVPLIHDMIPAMMPDHCAPELVHEFIDWLIGVLRHADFFLAVSDSTKADLLALAEGIGRGFPAELVHVVPLANDLGSAATQEQARRVSLSRWDLDRSPYVLFVSTIESRKNQFVALDAWQQLIARHGRDKVPRLVLVGKRGFRSELVLDRRALNPDLADRVLVLHEVTDAELEALYRNCLFTLYPSLYEGWGLPVTESLRYGKVPLTSDSSSLPQAGGGLSMQFPTGSTVALVAALDQLIFDAARRTALEQAIAARFRPRTWGDVARDIAGAVTGWLERRGAAPSHWLPPVAAPGYYPLVRNRELVVYPGLDSAEMFRLGGWWRLEDFGCWTKPRGGALSVKPAALPMRIGLELTGIGGDPTNFRVDVPGTDIAVRGTIHGDAHRWVFLDVPDGTATENGEIRVHVQSFRTSVVVDPVSRESREIGVGVASFFLFGADTPDARLDFIEAVALGSLRDHLFGRAQPAES